MAAAAGCVARRMRLALPKRLSIVGFDDAPVATLIWPQLTTARQPLRAIARIAADLIIQREPRQRGWPQPVPRPRLDLEPVPRDSIASRAARSAGS